jgi:hypothetical protein
VNNDERNKYMKPITKIYALTSFICIFLAATWATAADCYLLAPGCLDASFGAGTGKVTVNTDGNIPAAYDQRKYGEAEAQYKEVIQLEEKVLGPEQRDTLNAFYNYAYQLAEQGKRNEAKGLAERAAKGAAKALGANDPNTREYVKFLEILENGQPITMPQREFRESFVSGKQT